MKTHQLITLCLLVSGLVFMAGCKGKKGNNNKKAEDLPAELAKAYQEDANRLALRELITSTRRTSELGTAIPEERVKYYFDALKKIYFMSKSDENIPDISHIHTWPDPDMQEVKVLLEKDSPFKEPFSQKRTTTTDMYLNQILSENKLSITNYEESIIGPMVYFKSPKFLNTKELAYMLTQIKGIQVGEAMIPSGDGNNITTGAEGKNALAIRYSVGEGDCPSGCIHRKYWVFYLNPDNTISYMGTRGELPGEEKSDGEE